jgi:PiT family inorganic phosphate transporter
MHQLDSETENVDAHKALVNYVPLVAAAGSIIITAMLLFKGLNKVDLNLSALENSLIILMVSALIWMTVYILARSMRQESLDRSTFLLFSWMQVFTAAGFAFSHGSNDIANAIGPFAAVLDVLQSGEINATAPVPPAAMLSFGIAMVVGLWFIGKEVIQTVGTELTRMHPASGFTAELSAASVVLVASTLGIPVSSTHILVGAVLGIGVVNRSTNWQLMKPIGLAWVITLPSAAILSAITLVLLRLVF